MKEANGKLYKVTALIGRISDSVMRRMIIDHHVLRRNTATPIDALQIAPYGLVRYLSIEVDDALEISEQTEI